MGCRDAGASRRRRVPRMIPGFALSRRPPTGEPPASRRNPPGDARFRRRRPHLGMRSQIDVATALLVADSQHRHAATARQRARVARRLVAPLPGPVAAPGTRSRSEHRSPGHRVARALHEEADGQDSTRGVLPDMPAERFEVGTVWLLPCPETSRRSSSRSAPATSASTSGSTIPMAPWIISSTALLQPLRCSRLLSWSRVAPARLSGRSRCRG